MNQEVAKNTAIEPLGQIENNENGHDRPFCLTVWYFLVLNLKINSALDEVLKAK